MIPRNHHSTVLIIAVVGFGLVFAAGCTRDESGQADGQDSGTGYMDVMSKSHEKARKMANVTPLQQEIKQYHALKGQYPASLDELEEWRGTELPQPPRGMTYSYDPKAGQIKAVPEE